MSKRKRWGVLASATLALGMMTIDVSAVRLALPSIQNELEISDVAQQWIVNAYVLTMGIFAIAGGRAGDRYGRRLVFTIGVVVFVSGSILCGLSDSSTMLIAARAGQGVGAAIMTSTNMAMVTDAFAGASLGKAMGVLGGVGTIGVSIGSLVGGLVIQLAGWEWIFFLNVPVAVVVVALVQWSVPKGRADSASGIDWTGLAGLFAGMTGLTLAVMQAPVWGLASVATLGLLGASILVIWAWLRAETRARDPLVDPELLRGATLGANFVAFCVPFVLTGLNVLLAIYLQNVLDYSPFQAGLLMLPLAITGMVGSLMVGWLLGRLGARKVVTAGMLVAALGVFLIGTAVEASNHYVAMVPGLLLFAFGGAVAVPSMSTALMASAEVLRRGMVSGVYNTARIIGGTLGLAVLGAMLAGFESSRLEADEAGGLLDRVDATHVHNLLAGGEAAGALAGLSAQQATAVQEGVRSVFDHAFADTLQLSAIVAIAGAAVAFRIIPRLRPPAAEDPVSGHVDPIP
jgi:EmrB/QacA subfamily drug resistance transporter